ncbi:acyl dehydratase [Loktanella sp. SALINAS62]|uniref:acyl dehydratase n=1 Tax=Loktanella sp. SALINAS62 TaxID=2706124 RepID=UPI001B8B32A4|nr:acyl dehydratase [Loktanella sp. SALINAS62]MBS1300981.1 acyl dehydratase [Loktanella sp. SALINAS62]
MNTAPTDTQTLTDPMDPARATALAATLGCGHSYAVGDPLPPFAHQIYFWTPQPPDALGRDGHPALGGFLPDLGLPRRMWAAGRLVFHTDLLAGVRAEKTSRVESITRKDGRSGKLAFVRVRHDIRQRQTLAVTEWQDLVYRADGGAAAAPLQAPTDEDASHPVDFDSTLLFRYSALTFNGHRIHYDETYAREVEGYDGLVVHGPLLAHLLMGYAAAELGRIASFDYRATSPLMHHQRGTLCRRGHDFWVRGPDGRLCMTASAT